MGLHFFVHVHVYTGINQQEGGGGGGKEGGGGWKAYTPVDLIQAEKYTIKAFQNNNIIRVPAANESTKLELF